MTTPADRLRAAREERERLIPVIGSGASADLGLPTWAGLLDLLGGNQRAQYSQMPAPAVLRAVQSREGDAVYTRLIQQALQTSSEETTLLHQALVTGYQGPIITLNLDHAIEDSFALAGKPLRPQDVLVGSDRSTLARFQAHRAGAC